MLPLGRHGCKWSPTNRIVPETCQGKHYFQFRAGLLAAAYGLYISASSQSNRVRQSPPDGAISYPNTSSDALCADYISQIGDITLHGGSIRPII